MDLQPLFDLLSAFAMRLLLLALPIVAGYVLTWLHLKVRQTVQDIKDGTGHQYDWMIDKATEYAVKIAEQTLSGSEEKKALALKFAQDWLVARGVRNVDVAILANIIESKVWDEFNSGK